MIKTISFQDTEVKKNKGTNPTSRQIGITDKNNLTKNHKHLHSNRPTSFDAFIGQKHITSILQKALESARKSDHTLGHILLCGPSGYGKTTLGHIIATNSQKQLHIVTGYAISKPADIISVLTSLQSGDILFIDEIHRLKPAIEEILYIAMEDFAIDMVMPDGGSVRIPLKPFTLIGATTKAESISEPLKNRFVYTFHCVDYSTQEKKQIMMKYLDHYAIDYDTTLISAISAKVDTVPRKIHALAIQIRDFLIATHSDMILDNARRRACEERLAIKDGGLTPIHQKYLDILTQHDHPVGLRTIALQLGMNEESIEKDIEPLLLKLNLLNKTSRGRILITF